jgi:hypothetical protein
VQSAFSSNGAGVGGNLGEQLSALLGNGASDTRSLHFSLGIDNNTSVVLEHQEVTFSPTNCFSLSHNNGGHNLLSEIGLSLLHRAHALVSNGSLGQSVKSGTGGSHSDNEKVFSSSVVGTVHDGHNGQTV